MALHPHFIQSILKVSDDTDNRIVLDQPFKPTSTGEQIPWADQDEAFAWWETQKSLYTGPDVTTPTV